MTQYIDKAALVAEIDSLQDATMDKNRHFLSSYHEGIFDGLSKVENFLDTLEVKEVDLDKIVDDWYNTKASKEFENVLYSDIENCAKYFFELGLMHRKDNLYGNKY